MTINDELRSDPRSTQRRYDELAAYMHDHVLSPEGFCCASEASCRGSLGAADAFAAGQLSHVGHHYDLFAGERPLRVLVLGMDTGRPDGGVTLEQRRQQVYDRVPEPFSRRNPHMRGTTLALRVLLGREQWDDRAEESLVGLGREPVHLLDAYAMANSRLCSAFKPGSTKSRGTPRMSANCLRHLDATLAILVPQVVVIQGAAVRTAIQPLVRRAEALGPSLERAELPNGEVLLASFAHPSYPGPKFNWSWPSSPYFQAVVLPTLRQTRRLALG
ncbi:MAG TPA: hypothetical protein VGN13_07150 [Solirubrobacteraceae bacterium]